MNIFLRVKLWYNGVCTKHLVYKQATSYAPGSGMYCPACISEDVERDALKKQALDNLIVELKKGR